VTAIDRAQRPNILLLVLDTLRTDAVEPYGAPTGSSPALADLARRGLAVPNVRSAASWTLPAHISMFTGELARGLGLGQAPDRTPQSAAPVVRAQRDSFLPEILGRAGYATAGVSTNVWAGKQSGFDTGFDDFVELDSSRQNMLGGPRVRQRLKWDWEGTRARADDGAAVAEGVIMNWVRDLDSRPFFWFVNLVECHSPYMPPTPHHRASPLTRLRVADEAHRFLTFEAITRACLGNVSVPRAALERMRHMYAGSLRYVDGWIERILGALADAGVLDDTLVIACSDHGENFGEAGLMAHMLSVDDRLLRVPFIVSGPSSYKFSGMLRLTELPARLAAAVGLDEHPWRSGLPLGLPVAQWDHYSLTHERVAEATHEWQLTEAAVERLTSPLTCAVAHDFKLIRGADGNDEALYDLEADPLELSPITERAEMAARAGEKLVALRSAVHHPAAQLTAEAAPPSDTVPADEVADIERRMRLMGYM